ncbi:MAG: TonB-dependent receptor [Acidobacteriia bacterium]|nr:TonB-dependent receptor [Terriglobia bacterium]
MIKRLLICALFVILAGLMTSTLWAQGQGTGSIEGVISDTTGAVMPGVKVVVRNLGTNAIRELMTDGSGHYRADLLPPGEYEVTATMTGFATAKIERLTLVVGSSHAADLKMQVAGGQVTVEVTSEAAVTDPERIEMTSTVGERAVQDLPINGRRWENFVLLTPGVTPDGDYGLVSYRGVSGLYNNNSIDGADNNQAFFSEARGRTRISYTISQAAVKEFQVGLSNFSAEFGRAAGGTVNAVTKSGTNDIHGEGFYFLRDGSFMAKNPRVNALSTLTEDQKKPPERRQQFGGSVGGPLVKDKVFFFANYDQQKRHFPGFVIPDTPYNLVACTVPGCAATIAFLNTQSGLFERSGDNYVLLGKLDWMINQNNTLTSAYNFQKWNSPNGIQTQSTITVSPSANGLDRVRTDMLNLRLTSVLTANTVNEFRFQFGRDFESQIPNSPGPSVSFTGGISTGMPNYLPRAAYPNEKRFQFADNYSFIHGNHSFKAGADINYVRELQINLYNGGGTYSYTSLNNLASDCPAQASGCVPVSSGATTGKHYSNFQQAFDLTGQNGLLFFPTTDWNLYLQDNYRFRPSFTLYFGIRYEYSQLPQPTNGNSAFPLTQTFNKDTNNFGPRFGFSWDVGGTHKTVLRGGYGMYYGRTSNSAIANGLLNNGIVNSSYYITPTSPVSPVFPNVLTGPPSGAAASTQTINEFAPDYVRPVIHSVDLVLERELSHGVTVSGSYLMSRGQRLPTFRDTNLPTPTGTITYTLPDGSAQGPFPVYLGSRPNSGAGAIIMTESVLNSSYNAFVMNISKRMSHGVQLQSNFTIAKAIDNGQSSQTNFASYSQQFDPNNLSLEKGLSRFDVRKRWVTNFILAPSVSRYTDNAFVKAVFNDWQFGGIMTFSDGKPQTATISGGLSGTTVTSTTNGTGGSYRVPFVAPGSYTGTGQATVDMRFTRTFKVSEKAKFQFIWEGFNLFNRVNYTSFNLIQFQTGTVQKTGTNFVLPLAPYSKQAFLAPINVGNTIFGPREFQMGLKFIW